MKNEIVTITGFKRLHECWVCSQCDSENPTVAGSCIVCGRQKSSRDRIVDPTPKNTDPFPYIDHEQDEHIVSVDASDIPEDYSDPPSDTAGKRDKRIKWLPIVLVLLILFTLGYAYYLGSSNASDDYSATDYDDETLQTVDASEDYIYEEDAIAGTSAETVTNHWFGGDYKEADT